jgi:hypothetical protein
MQIGGEIIKVSPHKKTLFDTVAHFRGWSICGQVIFRDGIEDLSI